MNKRKLLITGCPRSGTLHIAHLLREAGVRVKHENMAEDGTVSCFFAPLSAPYMQTSDERGKPHADGELPQDYEFEHVWHQVRSPLKVIPSLLKIMSRETWAWVAACEKRELYTGRSRELSILRAMNFWVRWNTMIEEQRKPELTYRVEDTAMVWPQMCRLLDIRCEMPVVSNTMHASAGNRKAEVMTWEDFDAVDLVVADKVKALAAKYGYL